MLNEAIQYLNCRPGKTYTDCTLGGSGHAKAICERILPDGLFIGIDQDIDAIINAQKALQSYSSNIRLFHGNFINLPQYLAQLKIDAVDGILLDLGLSLHQLENSGRGFSFNKDEPLDMRMDNQSATTADDLVNNLAEEELRKIFKDYGEERWSRQIARRIVKNRAQKKIQTSKELAQIVRNAIPRRAPSELEPRGPVVCFIVSLAGGSHCQAAYQSNGKRMHLSTEITRMRLRQEKRDALADQKGAATGR
jgi:16S rRNA (cytosine1402-N4)-methyltransferase